MYGIVKQSGGYIWVYSEPGKGTSFKIYMPHVTVEEVAAVEQPAAAAAVAPTETPRETILVVEDEVNLRRLTRQFLENQGYTVVEAADGAAAVQICVAHQGIIHLLLTDVIMPGMNGRELAQRVSEIRPNMKVLYMSGYTENAIGHNGTLDAGITLLQKPFTLHALKAKVREVLDQSTLPQEVAMSARAVINTESRVARDKVPRIPRATVQSAFAAALPGSRRTRMAARNDVEHQSVRTSLQCGRSPAAQRTTGNQPGVAGGNRWTEPDRSRLPRRSGSLRGKRRGDDQSGAGGENPAVSLPARLPRVGSVVAQDGRRKVGWSRAPGSARSLRFCGWILDGGGPPR